MGFRELYWSTILSMKYILIFLLLITGNISALASTTEEKLNIAISNIASAIEDISGNKGSVIKIPVTSELTKEAVEEAMLSIATSIEVRFVGELPISEMYELQTDQKQRFYKAYQYIDAADSMALINYNSQLSTVYPITIYLLEDFNGQMWLIANDIQSTISQYQTLPKYIQDILYRSEVIAKQIMNSGATGEF